MLLPLLGARGAVKPNYTVAELAEVIGASVQGDATARITGIASLADATASDLSHLSSKNYLSQLPHSKAAAVILHESHADQCKAIALCVTNPYWAFARISQLFEQPAWLASTVAPSAVIDATAQLGSQVAVGAGAVVGPSSTIGAGARLHPQVVIGAACVIGAGVELHPGVVLCDGVEIGANSVVHPNAVIGGEGFGYAPNERGELERIAQLGSVVIGANVSIGANATIDRGALGNTVIGDGVKIDNQVQIGHNCRIGDHSVICGCCGIVGSTTIGRHVVLGGGVGVGGDGPLHICDGVTVSGMTHVSRSIDEPGTYSGGVLHDQTRAWKRNAVRFRQLDSLARRVRGLEQATDGPPQPE